MAQEKVSARRFHRIGQDCASWLPKLAVELCFAKLEHSRRLATR
jgi:hypothetical protein